MPPQGSNINSVELSPDRRQVTITGKVEVPEDYTVGLLHVWLAQPGAPDRPGVGVAIDCFAEGGPAEFAPDGETFRLTVPQGEPPNGVVGGPFFEGPATVSVIAVLSPSKSGLVTQVLEWGRIAILPEDPDTEAAAAFSAG
jgi:hypothetical protein